jgi:hypothetical protein
MSHHMEGDQCVFSSLTIVASAVTFGGGDRTSDRSRYSCHSHTLAEFHIAELCLHPLGALCPISSAFKRPLQQQ